MGLESSLQCGNVFLFVAAIFTQVLQTEGHPNTEVYVKFF